MCTDPRMDQEYERIDLDLLKSKQERRMDEYLEEALSKISVRFKRPVSKINKKVAIVPVTPGDVVLEIN